MRAVSLQSGSNGNTIYVEAGAVKLLFDAGISGKQAQLRLQQSLGVDIRDVDALLISHDHRDHIATAGIYQRKFGLGMYVSEPTLRQAVQRHRLGKLGEIEHFRPGETIRIGEVTVETIPTPHDGVDGCGFIVQAQGRRLGILTDLGYPFADLGSALASCDAVYLESNYDPHMLSTGPYPAHLKARIVGKGGHISNLQAAELLGNFGQKLQWVALAHLSQDNNRPALAVRTAREILGRSMPIHVAGRYRPGQPLDVL